MPSVRANGITIAYETDGAAGGVPLVLVMGLGMPLVFWPDLFVDGLARGGFRVVRLDNRDCGQSSRIEEGPHTPIPLAMASHLHGGAGFLLEHGHEHPEARSPACWWSSKGSRPGLPRPAVRRPRR